MKYDKHHIDKITEALNAGVGRVNACISAGISYETFTVWMREKPEFSELIKKAEDTGNDKIKDLAKRGIIEKFTTQWQAAAWWLERNFPDEFRQRQEIIKNLPIEKQMTDKQLTEYIKKYGQEVIELNEN